MYPETRASTIKLSSSSYGRGAEIWPESNEEPVILTDSFPNGILPSSAKQQQTISREIDDEEDENNNNDDFNKKRSLPKKILKILRSASKKEKTSTSKTIDALRIRVPSIVALSLLFKGLVRPIDLLLVIFLTGYVTILAQIAQSKRDDNVTPVMPSLPPQGHVPLLVLNPLGHTFTHSETYRFWLKVGTLVGLYIPLVLIGFFATGSTRNISAAKTIAGPAFLLCCQALSEAISRRVMHPLPLRIFIPLAFNTMRLGPIFHWLRSSSSVAHVTSATTPPYSTLLGYSSYALSVANFLYWSINLFVFLVPFATTRYMRAHFLCVEAEEVKTRSGLGKESVGLV